MTKSRKLSYEEAHDELAKTVAVLEPSGMTLAESMVLWERDEELAAIYQTYLDEAKVAAEKQTADNELRDPFPKPIEPEYPLLRSWLSRAMRNERPVSKLPDDQKADPTPVVGQDHHGFDTTHSRSSQVGSTNAW